MHLKLNIAFLWLYLCFHGICAIEPITLGISAGFGIFGSIGFLKFTQWSCYARECCDENWLLRNISGLSKSLEAKLHGQHLVKKVLTQSLAGHLNPRNQPKKALTLSFHGWTGSGKNFVSRIVAQHLYEKGMKSSYVHLFIATAHFPHASLNETYKEQIQSWIRGNVTLCPRSMFIFDEMDKMPEGLLDVITPYVDYHDEINGVDYRKAIFVFLSNAGGARISRHALEHYSRGRDRTELTHKGMEEILVESAYNEKDEDGGGLFHSSLVKKHLISAYIPFLPLEREHVKLCVRDDLLDKGVRATSELLSRVSDELEYAPANLRIFSTSGCKRVSQKVDLLLEEQEME